MAAMESLPFVDDNTVVVAGTPEQTWEGLHAWVTRPMHGPVRAYARLIGVAGDGIFDVERAERPVLLDLSGRHRFSRYRLTLTLRPAGAGRTTITASTRAAFPGVTGSLYRAAVIGTGAHAVITRAMLRRAARGH